MENIQMFSLFVITLQNFRMATRVRRLRSCQYIRFMWHQHLQKKRPVGRIQESAAFNKGCMFSQPKIQALENMEWIQPIAFLLVLLLFTGAQSSGMSCMSMCKDICKYTAGSLHFSPSSRPTLGPLECKSHITPHFPPHPPLCLYSSAGNSEQWRPGRSLSWWRPQTRRFRRKWWWAGLLESGRPGTRGSCPWRAGSGIHVCHPLEGSTPCPPLLHWNGKWD